MTNYHPLIMSPPMVRALLDPRKTQTRRLITPENIRFFDGHGNNWKPSAEQMAASLTEASGFRHLGGDTWTWKCQSVWHAEDRATVMAHSKWAPGDRLWVRENWAVDRGWDHVSPSKLPDKAFDAITYTGTGDCHINPRLKRSYRVGRNRPSIHIPRRASRILLEITEIRVERLNDISEADCIAEGIEPTRLDVAQVDGKEVPIQWYRDYHPARVNSDICHAGALASYQSLWESINGAGSWAANPWVWVIVFKLLEVKR